MSNKRKGAKTAKQTLAALLIGAFLAAGAVTGAATAADLIIAGGGGGAEHGAAPGKGGWPSSVGVGAASGTAGGVAGAMGQGGGAFVGSSAAAAGASAGTNAASTTTNSGVWTNIRSPWNTSIPGNWDFSTSSGAMYTGPLTGGYPGQVAGGQTMTVNLGGSSTISNIGIYGGHGSNSGNSYQGRDGGSIGTDTGALQLDIKTNGGVDKDITLTAGNSGIGNYSVSRNGGTGGSINVTLNMIDSPYGSDSSYTLGDIEVTAGRNDYVSNTHASGSVTFRITGGDSTGGTIALGNGNEIQYTSIVYANGYNGRSGTRGSSTNNKAGAIFGSAESTVRLGDDYEQLTVSQGEKAGDPINGFAGSDHMKYYGEALIVDGEFTMKSGNLGKASGYADSQNSKTGSLSLEVKKGLVVFNDDDGEAFTISSGASKGKGNPGRADRDYEYGRTGDINLLIREGGLTVGSTDDDYQGDIDIKTGEVSGNGSYAANKYGFSSGNVTVAVEEGGITAEGGGILLKTGENASHTQNTSGYGSGTISLIVGYDMIGNAADDNVEYGYDGTSEDPTLGVTSMKNSGVKTEGDNNNVIADGDIVFETGMDYSGGVLVGALNQRVTDINGEKIEGSNTGAIIAQIAGDLVSNEGSLSLTTGNVAGSSDFLPDDDSSYNGEVGSGYTGFIRAEIAGSVSAKEGVSLTTGGADSGVLAYRSGKTEQSGKTGDIQFFVGKNVYSMDEGEGGGFTVTTGSVTNDYDADEETASTANAGVSGSITSIIGYDSVADEVLTGEGHVSVDGDIRLTVGGSAGQKSGSINSMILGNAVTKDKFVLNTAIVSPFTVYADNSYSSTTNTWSDTTAKGSIVGEIHSLVGGSVATYSGYEVLASHSADGEDSSKAYAFGSGGDIHTSIQGDLIVMGIPEDAQVDPATDIKFYAGDGTRGVVHDRSVSPSDEWKFKGTGASITAFDPTVFASEEDNPEIASALDQIGIETDGSADELNVIDGGILALGSKLDIKGGKGGLTYGLDRTADDDATGGSAVITVGGKHSGTWSEIGRAIDEIRTGLGIASGDGWTTDDAVAPQYRVRNEETKDILSTFAVTVGSIDLNGGSARTLFNGNYVALDDGGAAGLHLTGAEWDYDDPVYREGNSIYSAGDITISTGSDMVYADNAGTAGDAGIAMDGRDSGTLTLVEDVVYNPYLSNIYAGGNISLIAAAGEGSEATAYLGRTATEGDGAGKVVLMGVEYQDGDPVAANAALTIRNVNMGDWIGNSGKAIYDAQVTDFSNLTEEQQVARVDIAATNDDASDIQLGELRYGHNNEVFFLDGFDHTDDHIGVDSVTASQAGTIVDYREGLDENAVLNDADDINFANGNKVEFDATKLGGKGDFGSMNFEVGDEVSETAGDAMNKMSVYKNGIRLGDGEVALNLDLFGLDKVNSDGSPMDPSEWIDGKRIYRENGPTPVKVNPSFIEDGEWREQLVLIQNGENDDTDAIDGHIMGGDQVRFYQGVDENGDAYDIVAGIWKGQDGTGVAADSQILLGYADFRLLRGQSILQNRIASVGHMNSAWNADWNFLGRLASIYDECGGWGAFGNVGYIRDRFDSDTGNYNSWSKVDSKGMNAIAGVTYRTANTETCGSFFGALFFEGGIGSFDSYDTFDLSGQGHSGTYVDLHGSGDINHYGGGFYLNGKTSSGLKGMLAGRAGYIESEYANAVYGVGKFDINGMYYGASAGVAWEYNKGNSTIEPYAAFHWLRQQGDDNLKPRGDLPYFNGMRVRDIDSARLQMGLRYAYRFGKCDSPYGFSAYAGAAWEHEFAGEAKGEVWNLGNRRRRSVANDTLQGSSAIANIGVRYDTKSRFYFDANLNGSLGRHKSWGGNIGAGFTF